MPVRISCSNQSLLFSPSLLLLFKPKTVQNIVLYYLSIFPRLSAAIIGLTVNKTLGYNASHWCMQGHNTVLKVHSSDTSRYQERQQLLRNFLYYVALDFYHGIHAMLKSTLKSMLMHARVSCLRYNVSFQHDVGTCSVG